MYREGCRAYFGQVCMTSRNRDPNIPAPVCVPASRSLGARIPTRRGSLPPPSVNPKINQADDPGAPGNDLIKLIELNQNDIIKPIEINQIRGYPAHKNRIFRKFFHAGPRAHRLMKKSNKTNKKSKKIKKNKKKPLKTIKKTEKNVH
jgi:hypothetical protein